MAANAAARLSLTARLALGFVALLAAAHIGICVYLDYAVQAEFLGEDQRQLRSMEGFLRNILAGSVSLWAFQGDRGLLQTEALHTNMEFVLRDARGEMAESAYDARWLIDAAASAANQPGRPSQALRILRQDGRVWRVLLSEAQLGDESRTSVAVVIAREITEREAFAMRYRARLGVAAIVAVAAAGIVGLALVRRALAPLDGMARRAGVISATSLDERLPVAGIPRELRGFAQAFNQTLERLQESFRRLSQFSSDLAHDLRTPIGNLMGEAQVALRRARSAEEYKNLLVSAVEEYERIGRMIDGMLFLARVDNAKSGVRPERLDGAKEVERVVEYYEGLVADRGLRVHVEGEAVLFADPDLLRRAVSNLLSNAIAHTAPGGLISVKLSTEADDSPRLEVVNPGPGIAPEVLPRVFDRFYRGDAAREGSERGSGLGLAIVHSIMQLHSGSVSVYSSEQGPTAFVLQFPPPLEPASLSSAAPIADLKK